MFLRGPTYPPPCFGVFPNGFFLGPVLRRDLPGIGLFKKVFLMTSMDYLEQYPVYGGKGFPTNPSGRFIFLILVLPPLLS